MDKTAKSFKPMSA